MTLLARVVPHVVVGGRRAGLLLERNLLVYRRGWLVIVSGFFEPLFYLFSIGLGIGALVGSRGPRRRRDPVHGVRGTRAARQLGDERRDL